VTLRVIGIAILAAVASAQASPLHAALGDPFKNLPSGWKVVSTYTVPDDQVAQFSAKLGGRILELSNTILSVNGERLQANIVRCETVKDAEAVHRSILATKTMPALCLRVDDSVVEFVGDDIGLVRRAHYVLGLRPREATYRVTFEIATIDRADYMVSNNLFNLLLQLDQVMDTEAEIRELSKKLEFGNTVSLRTGPGSAGKPATYKFGSPPILQRSKGADVTSYSFRELQKKADVPYVSVQAVITCAAFRDTPTDRKPDGGLLAQTAFWPVRDERIGATAKEITAGLKTDAEKVEAILAWMMPGKNVEYSGPMGSRHGVKKVIQQGFGRCWDFSDVFVTLCRASGVPARQVAGWLCGQSGHVWAEVLIGGKGWRQVDPTAGSGCDIDYIPWFTTEDGEMPIVYTSMPKIEITEEPQAQWYGDDTMRTGQDIAAKCRMLGEARIDVAKKAKTREDWERLWDEAAHPYTFEWGDCWKQCIEYKVADFAAEVGFYIDILGMPPNALSEDYAMVMSPDGAFYLSFSLGKEAESPTPPEAISIQFMLKDILKAAEELESRGIVFDEKPQPYGEGSPLYRCIFRTPNSIPVHLWGMVTPKE
jgi:hypothetical protein